MNRQQQQDFLHATAWLRPLTRQAAAFSMASSGWLPAFLRNLPLQLIRRLLAHYQKRYSAPGSGSGGCGGH